MMSHFMGRHISHGKIAFGAKIRLQLMKKVQVDIHLLVCRAIKRPHGSSGTTTFRYCLVGKGYQRRIHIALLQLRPEYFAPHVVGTVEYTQGEYLEFFVFVGPGGVCHFCRLPRHHAVHHIHCLKGILSQQQCNNDNYNGSHTAQGGILSASSPTPAVLEIGLTVVSIDPLHVIGDLFSLS